MPEPKLPKAWQSWRTIKSKDPKALAKLAAEGCKLRAERQALEARAKVLAAEEHALREHMLAEFDKADLKSIETKHGRAYLYQKAVPQVAKEDWPKVYAYVREHDAFDLFTKRLHEGAVKERWEAKEQIPGVTKFNVVTIKFGDSE